MALSENIPNEIAMFNEIAIFHWDNDQQNHIIDH